MEDEATQDHEHMLAVREGDLRRLGVLFDKHHRRLFNFFVRCSGDHAASEDLVQQVFYRILKYRHTYRDQGKFTTWMYHLARRVAADQFRRRNTSREQGVAIEELQDFPDQSPHAEEQACRSDELALLRRALAELPFEQTEQQTLHRFQRLSHEELSEVFDCSVGAVKVRVHRALASLKERFLLLQVRGARES